MNEKIIPANLRKRVERELQPGEQIEWIGMPVPRFFTSGGLALFIVGAIWTTLITLWIIGYTKQEDALAFSLFWGFPFMVIGLLTLSGPIWIYRGALKTVYVITDKRAITIEAGRSGTTRSYTPDILKYIYTKKKKDGIGDVIISRQDSQGPGKDKKAEKLGFLQIRDPEEIEEKLRKLSEPSGWNRWG